MSQLLEELRAAAQSLHRASEGMHVCVVVEFDIYSENSRGMEGVKFRAYTNGGGWYTSTTSLDHAVAVAVEGLSPASLISQAEALEQGAAKLREQAKARKDGAL